MAHVTAYHRPHKVEEAIQLLRRDDCESILIAGGTHAVPHLQRGPIEVVDLQGLGLNRMDHAGDSITLGAMVRLQAVEDDGQMPSLLRELAHREGPNTFRNAATVGGVIVGADWESELLPGLLVYRAKLTIETLSGPAQISLEDFLLNPQEGLQGGILTELSLERDGASASARVARTPADRAIVSATARRDSEGEILLALSGVAETPIMADSERLEVDLNPPDDFRGSSEYRKRVAGTLSRRALQEIR